MQILNSSKQHVAVILVLELCFYLTSNITNGHVDTNETTTSQNNMIETTTLQNNMIETTLQNNMIKTTTMSQNNMLETTISQNNMIETTISQNNKTELKTCDNCSSWANDFKQVTENCSNSRGWNLRGSDWGCCGNYHGCCVFASFICFVHDALCKCCDVGGNFCGPTCKPEVTCVTRNYRKIKKNKCRDKISNFTNFHHNNREYFNVKIVDQTLNNTENKNNTHRNYFLRGRAVSGSEENVITDGDDCEEGSGEIDS